MQQSQEGGTAQGGTAQGGTAQGGGQRSPQEARRLAGEAMEDAAAQHDTWANQHRDEPMPASHDSGRDQAEPARLTGQDGGQGTGQGTGPDAGQHSGADAGQYGGPDTGPDAGPPGAQAAQGDAVRDMMGGPPPQGDVPDAPATQIAATRDEDEGGDARVRHVANAVPGKPDGEVDTRS